MIPPPELLIVLRQLRHSTFTDAKREKVSGFFIARLICPRRVVVHEMRIVVQKCVKPIAETPDILAQWFYCRRSRA